MQGTSLAFRLRDDQHHVDDGSWSIRFQAMTSWTTPAKCPAARPAAREEWGRCRNSSTSRCEARRPGGGWVSADLVGVLGGDFGGALGELVLFESTTSERKLTGSPSHPRPIYSSASRPRPLTRMRSAPQSWTEPWPSGDQSTHSWPVPHCVGRLRVPHPCLAWPGGGEGRGRSDPDAQARLAGCGALSVSQSRDSPKRRRWAISGTREPPMAASQVARPANSFCMGGRETGGEPAPVKAPAMPMRVTMNPPGSPLFSIRYDGRWRSGGRASTAGTFRGS